jgi:hypothetical protein
MDLGKMDNFGLETIMLKISKKGVKGFQIHSVPMKKLKKLNDAGLHGYCLEWNLWENSKGEFLVLHMLPFPKLNRKKS